MPDFLKEAVKILHDILVPIANKLGDPESRSQYQQSIGYKPGDGAPAPVFPNGSAMETYFNNQEDSRDELLFAQSLEEVSRIIDVLKSMFETGAAAYYSIKPGDTDRDERIQEAVSELLTLTTNIFTLDYFRFRYPFLHNGFLISGTVDEMGQRAGGSGFLGKVIWDKIEDFFRGMVLKDEKTASTFIQTVGLGLTILKLWLLKEQQLYLSGGFETYDHSTSSHADIASKSMLSAGWFFEHNENIKGNLYLTLGLMPKTRAGGGFYAKINAPSDFEVPFSDFLSMQLITVGDLEFFYANDFDLDAVLDKANKASIIFKLKPDAKNISLLKSPELSVGYGANHSIELRFSGDETGIIAKTEVNIKFGKGKETSFPFSFLPDTKYDENLPLTFGWTTKKGFFFNDAGTAGTNSAQPPTTQPTPAGSPSIARSAPAPQQAPTKPNLFFFNLPIKKSIAGLTFQNIHIGLGKDEGTIITETSIDFTFIIGKAFALSIIRIGGRLYVTPRDDNKGFLGNDLDLKFKAPTGIGMSIDAGVVKGGGFLSLDEEKGEYIGALELAIDLEFFKFSVKAFGIIQTKIPGAPKDAYSLFVVISSDFEPIPLIFGLTLNGVGGLFGHNRSADISLIQSEMETPNLENILFLKDPIANISRLVTDAGRYFPVGIDHTLIGISMIIGYGVPSVFELRLAVIFIKPDERILVPGILRLDTPKKSKILHLQVNFLAVLDRREGYFFFRADLVDSRIVTFKLTGSLVFAIGWGDSDGLFAISIGGFHPSYKHLPEIKSLPNAFKGLDRLRLSLWEEGSNHLYLELYLAITSNSRQLGAHAYLHVAGPAGFNIDGHLGFDILWETEPKCYFEASIEARIDFRHHDSVLAGVGLNALFTGPTPKHIEGKARLKICWFLSVSIPFSKTWGDPAPAIDEETVDLDELLRIQLSDDRNWRAEIPDFHNLHVTLKKDPKLEPNEILLQPLGALTFSQRALPLNHEIQRIGSRKAKIIKKLSIDAVSSNGKTFTDLQVTNELFAPGQFIDLKEDEKLARPSFENMAGGVRIGDTGISDFPLPFLKAKEAEYELTYIVPDVPSPKKKKNKPVNLKLQPEVFQRLSRNAAAAKSPGSWQSGKGLRTAPQKINIVRPVFSITNIDNLKVFTANGLTSFSGKSQSETEQIKNRLMKENPALEGKLQVVSNYELTT